MNSEFVHGRVRPHVAASSRSLSTARAVLRPARGLEALTSVAMEASALHAGLEATVDDLFLRTRKRSYLGVVRRGRIEIVAFHGRQGMPRMPGLGSEIRDSAHALAMGKVDGARVRHRATNRGVMGEQSKHHQPRGCG